MPILGDLSGITIAIFIGALVLFGALLFAGGDAGRARLDRRLKRIGGGSGDRPAEGGRAANVRKRENTANETVERLLDRLLPRRQALADRLDRTGRNIPVWAYVLFCAALAGVVALVGRFGLGLPVAGSLAGGLFIGLALPHYVIGWLVRRRLAKFLSVFPDALDLMVRTVKSGLPISEAIDLAGHELSEPVCGEFRRVSDLMKIGASLEDALWETADRLGLSEFRFFVVGLSVQRETGGNIAETLHNLSQLLRRRQQMKMKVKALSAEARASAWIVGALPFGMFAMLYFVNRPYLSALFEDQRGHVLIGFGLISQLIGVGLMMKMSRFEI